MRLMPPCNRIFLPATILFLLALGAFATVEHRAKAEASLYRTRLLEPPPLAQLAEGETVTLIHQGEAQSLVKTGGGLRGWVRNADLVEMTVAGPTRHAIREQIITPGDFNHSFDIGVPADPEVEMLSLDRSFAAEVVEAIDREQLEMRNDEN